MSKATILIVEDEAIVAADLAGMLGRLGYEISGTTGHGEEATSLARERRPDLVLMDIRLAGAMDGVEAAGIIRRELDLPVIFLTAHSDKATLERAKLTEPFGYLLKPFEELGLETHIEMALYKHRAERKLRQSHDELELRVEERTRELREAEKGLKESNETLERRVAERTAELQAANILLRDSRLAALNMMEDADIARRRAVEVTAELRNEVTIRKQAEQAMRESELFYRQTLDSIPGMVFTTRPDGYCDFQSQQWVDFTGVPMIEHLGDGWNKLLHPDDRPRAYAAWQAAVEERAPYDLEYRVRRHDGEYEWFKVRGRPIRNTAGEIVRWFGTALNIDHLVKAQEALRSTHDGLETRVAERTAELADTVNALQKEIVEREKADKALRVSEQKFRTLFEESKDVIYIKSLDGRLTDVNPAGVELFGYSREELLSLDIQELYCEPSDRERFIQDLFANGYVRDFDVCMRRKGNEPIHVLNTATVIRTEQGEIAGYRGIIHDITERKKLELQLLQSQKMESIGMLAGGVAHDFNNLLTAISGYGQIIQEQYAAGDEMLGMCIEQIISATNRAVELTRNLLAFSRKQIINPYPLQVDDIVISMSKLLVRIIGEDIEFSSQFSDKPLTVMADKGQIDQVLVNLATNSRDAMPQGGRLLIGTEQVMLDEGTAQRLDLGKGGAYALITVADSGEGMDRETLEKIFEPFYTTKETGKGTGLGLSIIYGIIKQHNGAITVTSEPGKGSTFTIYLPLVEAATTGETREEEAAAPARGVETLLLAEDDPMVRKYMKQILGMAGYTVITAQNGAEAVDLFRENRDRIALVVCDVVMPKKNGKEVYDEIRAMNPEARFLFVSGYNDEIIHTKGILLEDFNLLTKPVNRQQLLAKLREMLE